MTLPSAFMVAGVGLLGLGLALWSVPLSCVVIGLLLFVSGGLAARQRA